MKNEQALGQEEQSVNLGKETLSTDMCHLQFQRNEAILGKKGIQRLQDSTVMVVGLGGVGGSCCEALARAGVGRLVIWDGDVVEPTNINRQIIATYATLGMPKTKAMAQRISDINPRAQVTCYDFFLKEETVQAADFQCLDYVVDAIDDVPSKVLLIALAKEKGLPIISAMGAANKMDPSLFQVGDISKTKSCPLAKKVRSQLRKIGIDQGVKTVWSPEQAIKTGTLGSLSFVPPVMGMVMAGAVIEDLTKLRQRILPDGTLLEEEML